LKKLSKRTRKARKVVLGYVQEGYVPFITRLSQKLLEVIGYLEMKKGVPIELITKAFSPLFGAIKNFNVEGEKIPVEQLYKQAIRELVENEHLSGLRAEDVYKLPLLPGMSNKALINEFLFKGEYTPARKYKNIKEVLKLLNPQEQSLTKKIPGITQEKQEERTGQPFDEATQILRNLHKRKDI
jgi:hypothetical protein